MRIFNTNLPGQSKLILKGVKYMLTKVEQQGVERLVFGVEEPSKAVDQIQLTPDEIKAFYLLITTDSK